MVHTGRSASALAGAAGIALTVVAVGFSSGTPSRDLNGKRLSAKRTPADVQVALGLKESTSLARALCFDPLRPPSLETMALVNQIMEEQGGLDYQLGSGTWPGIPGGTLTWSFVPDGTPVPNLNNQYSGSTLFSSMDSKFGGNRALWISKFQAVFDRWEAVSGVKYQRVTNNGTDWDDGQSFPNAGASNTPGATRGAVRISMRTIDGTNNVLAFNYYPTTGDMVIDSAEFWQNSSGDYRFFRNTISHEHGHGLGLAHCCPMVNQKLMEPLLTTSFDGPQHDDIRGSHAKYGDFYEPNATYLQAANLGTINSGTTFQAGTITSPAVSNATKTSIHNISDQDWYKFTVTSASTVNVTLTPRGFSYPNGPQNSNGSCSSGTTMNALTAGDINLAVYSTNGTTLMQQATPQPAGTAESISGLVLPAAGTYYVRVTGASVSSVQMYDLSIQVAGGNICPTFTQQPITQQVCVGSPLILSATAAGAPTPTYQWKKNNVNIPGATSSSLVIPSATVDTQGTYVCVATNTCGSQNSNPAVITVPTPITITQQPQNLTVNVGQPASFTAVATGTGLIYQWYNGSGIISGATSATYSIPSATLGDADVYRCQIYHTCDLVFTNWVTLTVNQPVACYANCDGSTSTPVLNVSDFGCFLSKFAANDPYANCDGSTSTPILNVSDFGCFLSKFAAGCQ